MGVGALALLVGCGKAEPARDTGATGAPPTTTAATNALAAKAGDDHGHDHAKGDDHGHDHAKGDDHGHGHGEPGHAHRAPHGGQVVEAGGYHLEAVASKAGLMLFMLDDEEETLPIDGVEGTVLLKNGDAAPVESAFEAMGNHLHAMAVPQGKWVAAVTLDVKGKTVTARFEGGGGEAHAHAHDHDAMPEMKLSEAVDAALEAPPIEAGKPARLVFSYKGKADGTTLADFEVVHQQKLHMFVVKKDMSFFDHVHPVPADAGGAAGTWIQEQVFPTPGEYRIYSDFKSTRLGANVTMTTLVVPGAAPADQPLTLDTAMTKSYGDLTITLATEPAALAAADAMLRYSVKDAAGQPVTDLEPYLGAFGHLFILNEDLVTMAHAHPRGAEPTPEMRAGPEVAFHTVLPKAGRYKLWAQFQRGGKIVTTDWAVEVK